MNFIQKWGSKLLKLQNPPEKEIKYVRTPASEVTLKEWRANPKLVGASMELLRHQTYALQMQCLNNEHPCHTVLALGVSPNDRLAHASRIEGYEMCLNNLQAFAKLQKLPERLEASFEPDNKPLNTHASRTQRP